MSNVYKSNIAKVFRFIFSDKKKLGYAVTIGQTTYYSLSKKYVFADPKWIAHEEEHKRQYARLGFWTFLRKYFYYQIRYGYKNNPLEVEARKAAEKIGD